MKRKNVSGYLVLSYALVFIMFLLVSLPEASKGGNSHTLLINGGMLFIVLIIYLFAIKRFNNAGRASMQLSEAADMIRNSVYLKGEEFFRHFNGRTVFFEEPNLSKALSDYTHEYHLAKTESNGRYNISIDDYINRNLIDDIIHKPAFNMVPGILTGLGILGTFAGLTIGLQSFNTGTSAEIANSIAPLMDGIKVAFHTSLYGMSLSLMFNYIFRRQLDIGYESVDEFLDAFEKNIVPDAESVNRSYVYRALDESPQKIAEALKPNFESMINSFDQFVGNVSAQQVTGIESIVGSFIEQMNESLEGGFKKLADTLKETCRLQDEQNKRMDQILSEIYNRTDDVEKIHEQSLKIIDGISHYVDEINELNNTISENIMCLSLQNEESAKVLEETRDYFEVAATKVSDIESHMEEGNRVITNTYSSLNSITEKTSQDMRTSAQELANVSVQLNADLSNALEETFRQFDEGLSSISRHLSGTISEIDASIGKTPRSVTAAYTSMQKELVNMQQRIEILVANLSDMIARLPRGQE